MEIWEIILFITSLVIMLIGMTGIILPILPSTPLIWIGSFIYALFTRFEKITWMVLLILGLLTVVSFVLESLGNLYGAKKFGASRWGLLGSMVGFGFGLYMGGLVGIIIGPVAGTIFFEFIAGKGYRKALRSGIGNFLGFLGGTLVKLVIGLLMIGLFVYKVFE